MRVGAYMKVKGRHQSPVSVLKSHPSCFSYFWDKISVSHWHRPCWSTRLTLSFWEAAVFTFPDQLVQVPTEVLMMALRFSCPCEQRFTDWASFPQLSFCFEAQFEQASLLPGIFQVAGILGVHHQILLENTSNIKVTLVVNWLDLNPDSSFFYTVYYFKSSILKWCWKHHVILGMAPRKTSQKMLYRGSSEKIGPVSHIG